MTIIVWREMRVVAQTGSDGDSRRATLGNLRAGFCEEKNLTKTPFLKLQ